MEEKRKESREMEEYFRIIEDKVMYEYSIATHAREKGMDPEKKPDIPIARNMAERVEGLISVVAPELVGTQMTPRILELEGKYGAGAWEVALILSEEVAKEKFCSFSDKKHAMEIGIRAGMAYTTAGIVAAPLEGFIELKIKKRKDGKEFFSIFYAGPIRGAGGTAAAVSVIIADYVRKKMDYFPYDPDENEVKRYIAEIRDYHERVTNLQYYPSEDEIKFLVEHIPVEINGDPTEKIEVSNYKDLPRVETNRIRGGMCLVLAEGVSQKSPKLWKRLQKWGKDFELDWGFLEEFLALQKKIKAGQEKAKSSETKKISPNYTYIKDMVAGRPVLTHPMRDGGFRLRMGRSRTSGFSALGLHPATQIILDNFIAVGTQLKMERPGKAGGVTVCDSIEGPIVKLKNGNVLQLSTIQEAKQCTKEIDKILFLGDILINFGDFSENGHSLVPVGYCEEWYTREFEKTCTQKYGGFEKEHLTKLSEETGISYEILNQIISNHTSHVLEAKESLILSNFLGIPFHPKYTYYWKVLSVSEILALIDWLKKGSIQKNEREIEKIILPFEKDKKVIIEKIGLPHTQTPDHIIISKDYALALLVSLGIKIESSDEQFEMIINTIKNITNTLASKAQENRDDSADIINLLNQISLVKLRDKAGTFIGARMGRPEKAKMRKMTGSPHLLFPVGDEGGRLRSFHEAIEAKKVTAHFPLFKCGSCDAETVYPVCERCGANAQKLFTCKICGPKQKPECPTHGPCNSFSYRSIDIKHYFESALKKIGMNNNNNIELIKGVRNTSNKEHIPEHLSKGILRAKHDIYVNKDGTTRYDMSELPITHFKPSEIGTPIELLKVLGYTKDIHGKELADAEQILELKTQDVILAGSPDGPDLPADEILFRIARFIDDLLVNFYGLQKFYDLKDRQGLIGQLIIGLAPHISAGIIGRIIGFSKTQTCFAHPLFHAAMRRDCDGDEACAMMLMDALLNFSRQFLPDSRGSRTMDSPLVLTLKIVPSEVDDQALGIDVVWKYNLDFYDACAEYKKPWEIQVEQLRQRLHTEKQYEGMGFTHNITNINMGVCTSSYKILPSMEEKLKGQMELAEKIMAVDEVDVARMVIEKHFIKDIKGNLRKFSMQQFRCVKCNEKFRRPPLVGNCTKCGGKIIFTISEGSIIKYLEPAISLAQKYDLSPYLKQTLEITKNRIEEVFGREKEKQVGLGAWFG